MPRTKRTIEERIMNKVIVNEQTDCWHFTGAKNNIGYGMVRLDQKRGMMTAHKAMYQEHNIMIVPDDFVIMHKCENYNCVNPDHLEMSTRKEVVKLMQSRNKHNFFGGKTRKGIKQPTMKCVHCDRHISKNVIDRWHNDNCKNKPKHK